MFVGAGDDLSLDDGATFIYVAIKDEIILKIKIVSHLMLLIMCATYP